MQTMTQEQLSEKIASNDNFLLINVLPRESVERTIPRAINIPHEEGDFEKQVEQAAGSKDKEIVVFCGSKECPASTQAAEKLEKAGFTNITDFEGGIAEWEKSGRPLVSA